MKKLSISILVATLFAIGVTTNSGAAVPSTITEHVPGTMNYQGRLVGPTGSAYADATYTFDIRLYTVANGGTPLWGGTYSSYVKDGYFNIMLGAQGGAALAGTSYTHTDLWKALWPDSANGAVADPLYLGVTPWQNGLGVLVDPASRTELSPRQTLMTAPYAFRAQTAEYANQAGGNFAVGGSITAANITTANNLLNTVGTIANVGGADGNTAANSVNINAKGVDIDAGTDDLALSSADRIDIAAAGVISIKPQSSLDLESENGSTYLKGKSGVHLSSSTGSITLNPQDEVVGYNKLTWNVPGTTQQYSPISIRKQTVTFASGGTTASAATGLSASSTTIAIVGLDGVQSDIKDFYSYDSGGFWTIKLTRNTSLYSGVDTLSVHYITFSNHWVKDYR